MVPVDRITESVQNTQPMSIAGCDGRAVSMVKAPVDPKPAGRLVSLRKQAGFEFAVDAARAMGVNETTYQHHENATGAISRKAAETYARFYRVPAGTILYGDKLHTQATVPIVGALAADGRVTAVPIGSALPREVAAPPVVAKELHALVVTTQEMFPAYRKGDVVYFEAAGHLFTPADIDGEECIVRTDGGDQMLRFATANKNGLFTLSSYAGLPLVDVKLVFASRVIWVNRGAARH